MFRFSKIICIRKIYFSSTIADTKMLMSSQDFQMVLKMCSIKNHNNGVHKLKYMGDIQLNKIESEKNILINK